MYDKIQGVKFRFKYKYISIYMSCKPYGILLNLHYLKGEKTQILFEKEKKDKKTKKGKEKKKEENQTLLKVGEIEYAVLYSQISEKKKLLFFLHKYLLSMQKNM